MAAVVEKASNQVRSGWRNAVPLAMAVLVAAAFPIRMLLLIRSGSHVQNGDYWHMILTTFRPDGWLDIGGLFELHNEHPVAVAKLMYWLNARVFGGSNITLGYIVVAVVLVQVVLLLRMIRSTRAVGPISQAAVLLGVTALLFAPRGSWNFVLAMSGTAWLTANTFALAAIWSRAEGRRFLAVGLGVLSSLTYGTGLIVWPAMTVAGLLRDRRPKLEWPTVLAAAATVAWYLPKYPPREDDPFFKTPGVFTVFRNAATIAGSAFFPGDNLATVVGLLGGGVALVLAGLAVRAHGSRSAPCVGVFVYALGSLALIGYGRFEWDASRYTSLAAMFWISLLLMLVLVVRHAAVHVLACAVIAVSTWLSGSSVVQEMRDLKPPQDVLGVALRLGLADGHRQIFGTFPPVQDLVTATGHHPFDGRFDQDCGLLGRRVSPDQVRPVPRGHLDGKGDLAGGTAAPQENGKVIGAMQVNGWLVSDAPIRCIVVADESGEVIGVGTLGFPLSVPPRVRERFPATSDGFLTLSPLGADRYRVLVAVEGSSLLRELE